MIITLLGLGLIKINDVSANFNNPRPSLILNNYRISANSCRDNYSFFEAWVRQLFKGDNYSKEETINFFLFGWCTMYICNLNCCRAKVKVSKSQKYFFLKLHFLGNGVLRKIAFEIY